MSDELQNETIATTETAAASAPAENTPAPAEAAPATPAPPAKVRTTYLSEAARFETGEGTDYTVPVTLIQPGWSANGRHYGRDVLGKSAAMFEGVKAYADHPGKQDEANRPERSVRDIVGYYRNVRQTEDGALRADLHVVGEARTWLFPLVQEAVTNKPDLIGLSINAMGKTRKGSAEGRDGIIVEEIVKGNSTDIVTTAAAGGRFERLRASADDFTSDLLANMEYDEWREARPEYIQRLREEVKTLRQDEALKERDAQIAALQEAAAVAANQLKELEEAGRAKDAALADMRAEMTRRASEAYADKLLRESKLPTGWQAMTKAQLLQAGQSGEWAAMVEAERVKYHSVQAPINIPRGQQATVPFAESNPLGGLLGVGMVPLPNERPEQFAERKARLLEAQGKR